MDQAWLDDCVETIFVRHNTIFSDITNRYAHYYAMHRRGGQCEVDGNDYQLWDIFFNDEGSIIGYRIHISRFEVADVYVNAIGSIINILFKFEHPMNPFYYPTFAIYRITQNVINGRQFSDDNDEDLFYEYPDELEPESEENPEFEVIPAF
jgi:hypothetical protein